MATSANLLPAPEEQFRLWGFRYLRIGAAVCRGQPGDAWNEPVDPAKSDAAEKVRGSGDIQDWPHSCGMADKQRVLGPAAAV
jgi:hypothetical protein